MLAVVSAASLTVASLSGAVPAAAAGPDCLSSHCYSDGRYDSGPQQGAHLAVPLSYMASGPADLVHAYGVTSEMWVNLDSAGHHYIEAGIRSGFQRPNNVKACDSTICVIQGFEPGNGGSATCLTSGCGAYELFWADTAPGGSLLYQYRHVVRFLSPNPGALEFVDIYYVGNGKWTVNFTGAYTYTGTSTIENGYTKTHDARWGAEYYGPKTNGECGHPAALGANMWGPNWKLLPVEMNVEHINAPFTGKARLSEWDWSIPGSC